MDEQYRDRYKEAREALEQVVKVLNAGTYSSIALWEILTALRGPDNRNSNLKLKTTATLRGKIGLREPQASVSSLDGSVPGFLSAIISHEEPMYSFSNNEDLEHFENHYNNALDALKKLGYIK